MLTVADRITLLRIAIAPVAATAYLTLPAPAVWWVAGWLCAAAELTDWLDGKVARARGEVSDFGKLADPFCDVFYRICMFFVLLLPAGGVGYVSASEFPAWFFPHAFPVPGGVAGADTASRSFGLMPFLPVLIMTLREVVAGALRSMCAAKGLVLAARTSGKVKAWFQGACIITALGLPAFFGVAEWHLLFNSVACWLCALLSAGSMIEYIAVNRGTLSRLATER